MIDLIPSIDAMIYRIGWMLVHSIWQGTLAAALLAVILRLSRNRLASNLRYIAAYTAMLAVISAALATAILAVSPAHHPMPIQSQAAKLSELPSPIPVALNSSIVANPQHTGISWSPERALPWMVAAWAAGVMVLSLWQFTGWATLQRWRRSAVAVDAALQSRLDQLAWKMHIRSVVMKLSDRVDVPLVIGIWKPVILAPLSIVTELPTAQLEAILAHELAHIWRWDYLTNFIHVAIETLLFYHPAIWWISTQIRLERECCCDELAAAACGDRTEYVKALTTLEQTRGQRLAPAISGGGGRGELLVRVRRLLRVSQGSTRSGIFEMRSWVTSVVLLSMLLGIAVSGRILRAQQQPQSTQPPPSSVTQSDPSASVPSHKIEPRMFRGIIPADAEPIVTTVQPEDLVPGPVEDYKIGRNDLVQITITNLTDTVVETPKVSRVTESGSISLPQIGQIKAADLTEAELEVSIAKTYRDQKLLANLQVSVVVVEARNRAFTIGGAIARPGQYQISNSPLTLMVALATAGGTAKNASVSVHRQVGDGSQVRIIQIPSAAVSSADPKFNIIIRPLDFINVIAADSTPTTLPAVSQDQPLKGYRTDTTESNSTATAKPSSVEEQELKILVEKLVDAKIAAAETGVTHGPNAAATLTSQQKEAALEKMVAAVQQQIQAAKKADLQPQEGEYYVGGYVQRTGVYSLTGRKITLGQALISAGLPAMDRPYYVEIVSRNGDQLEIVIRDLPLQDIFDGKQPDLFLKPDDQIMVRDSLHTQMPATLPGIRSDAGDIAQQQVKLVEINHLEATWNVLEHQLKNGEALTPTFVQLLLDQSDHLCSAWMSVATNSKTRAAALQSHLDQCLEIQDIVVKRQGQDTGRVQLSQVTSAVEGARLALERAKAAEN